MKQKQRKITNTMQEVAADILVRFAFVESEEEFWKEYHKIYEDYGLCDDPFTHLPCTSKEYAKNNLEHQRQIMFERYGHCDGLD